jgi:mono/diheme cytochrome c family protein/glucose/arabinose dehydrogenase
MNQSGCLWCLTRLLMCAAITLLFARGALLAAPDASTPAATAKPAPPARPTTNLAVPAETPDEAADMSMHTPKDEAAMIQLAPGYHLQLVASDPDLIAPVLCTWDGNGRMYVAEFRSYMLDIDATKEKEPVSRVSRWESTKGDGVYDRHTIFADNLMLPRQVLPLDERIIIRETDTRDMYAYRDTQGTGTSDQKIKIFEGGEQKGNLEHQPSALTWAMDNHLYITHDSVRFRFTRGKIETDKLAYNAGQWGMAMDDTGRLILSTAGAEIPAHDFQANWQYGKIRFPGELSENYNDVFPIIRLTDVQGGVSRLKKTGGLNHFTGCAGPSVYRGEALPADLYGDLLVPEPVGRFIRRSKMAVVDGKVVISNAYEGREFIASRDPNFRPVWTATGPDGCLYICDMYRGIIQEGNWTKEGSYLRNHILKYGLDKNINGGRIWRLVHDDMKPRKTQPHMLDEKPAQLVAHLSDPNGWWRDTAQKLLILRADRSVIPALEKMAESDANPLARLHALWTLEGLDAVTPAFVQLKMKDADPRLRVAAMRIAEPMLMKKPLGPDGLASTKPTTQPGIPNPEMMAAFNTMAADPDPTVANQYVLSLKYVRHPDADALILNMITSRAEKKLSVTTPQLVAKIIADNIAEARANADKQKRLHNADPRLERIWVQGRVNFLQTCVVCHGDDGKGTPTPEKVGTLAPPLAGSLKILGNRDLVSRIVLHGLVGPNDGGKLYPGEMAGFKFMDDQWIANVVTYVRNDFGNKAPIITAGDVAKVRRDTGNRDKPFSLQELIDLKLWTAQEKPPTTQATTKAVVQELK